LDTPRLPRRPDDLVKAVELAGTPTYVYDLSVIRERIDQLKSHLQGVPTLLKFAMKANSAPPLLEVIRKEGLGIDAVSPGEVELALRVGFRPDQILFSGNNMTDEEMHATHGVGVRLNVGELSRLRRFGEAYPGSMVCIRINPNIGAGHHAHVITAGEDSKFGIPVELLTEVTRIAAQHNLIIDGIHQHIGSGILDTEVLWRAMSVLLEAALDFPHLSFINVGGGLGIPYTPGDTALDMDRWETVIVDPLKKYLALHPSAHLSVMLEPGRFLVAECGTLIAQANTVKKTAKRTFVGLDAGMGHLIRPALYGAYHAISNLSNPDGKLQRYDVVGNICESADFFARDRMIQSIREGDLLAIQDAGAYGMSMFSPYNTRSAPAEVLLTADGPVVYRERMSSTDLVNWLYPDLPLH